jgi:hypothetical protein
MVKLYPVFVQLDVFENARGPFVIVPESGAQGQLPVFFDLDLPVGDVKETSSVPRAGTSYRLIFPVS